MEAIARLFTNDRSQAVRIPKALEFEGVSEVLISRQGDGLLLAPVRKSCESLPWTRRESMTTSWWTARTCLPMSGSTCRA